MKAKKIIVSVICIVLCLILAGGAFAGIFIFQKAGDPSMISNDDKKSYSTEFTEVTLYPSNSREEQHWRDGMVSGNGENGVVCSGSPYSETLIYQNIYFIMPSKDPRYTPDEVTAELEDARQAVINYDDTWDVNGRNSTYFYCFHPSHQLRLNMDSHLYKDYIRWTDYETAEVGVKYTDKNGTWERTTFTSREDNVTVTKITQSDKGEKINMTLSIDDCSAMSRFGQGDEANMQYKKLVDNDCNYIALIAHYPSYEESELVNGGYCGLTQVIVVDGEKERVVLDDTNEAQNVGAEQNVGIKITDASAVYLITKSDRTHNMGVYDNFRFYEQYDLLNQIYADTNAVAKKYSENGKFDYDKALAPHREKHSAMYNAVEFTLGNEDNKELSNEALIKLQQKSEGLQSAIVERAYNQGRYAQICCAGTLSPRLSGMWTGDWNPGWRSIYTMDANVNLQASGMNTGNVYDAGVGFIKFVLRQIPDWEENAAKTYGMTDAIQVPVNTDGDRAMMVEYSRWYPFQYWNAGASWMLLPIYEFWQCYGNTQIEYEGEILDLEKDILLPLLTKQANFWEQLCTPEYFTDINGKARYEKGKTSLNEGEKYLIIPSYSPENAPQGYSSTITANATMDISAARDGLNMTIAMEKVVKNAGYEERIAKLENLISLLPDYKYDDTGALCEWAMNEYQENNAHRHISHLYCAWPAYETQDNAVLTEACNIAIENRNRENQGQDDTASHGWVHKALVGARLKNADSAYFSLYTLMSSDIYYTSMMTDHNTNRGSNVYCTDTGIGTVGIIDEMLLYSNTGVIEALPALPNEWQNGSIKGLRARTNAAVDIEWNAESVTLTVTSDRPQTIEIRLYGGESRSVEFTAGETQTITFER